MFRRVSALVVPSSFCVAKRSFTPTPELQKLYEAGTFETAKFPTDIIQTHTAIFAKFLYKAAEPKNTFDAILKDFEHLDSVNAKLPVFWERSANLDNLAELKQVSPTTMFVMNWMQSSGLLEEFEAVKSQYVNLVNAQKKKVVATIYVAAGKQKEAEKAAKEQAKTMQQNNKATASLALDYKFIVDTQYASGFSIDVAGAYFTNAQGFTTADAAGATMDVDYTAVPAHKVLATKWDDNIETEMLRKYVDQMSAFDAEEQKNGV
jgi:hypothetical protein